MIKSSFKAGRCTTDLKHQHIYSECRSRSCALGRPHQALSCHQALSGLDIEGLVDGICVRDTVNTDFMEGVLPVSSTGFAPGSIYGSTFTLSNSQYGVCRAPLVQFCRAPPSTPLNFVRLRMFWNSRHKRSKDRLRTAAGACVDLVAMRRKGRCLSLC